MADHEQRKMAILMAAAAVFADRGFHRARTIDVARRANISKRDLYAAFPSKEALLSGLISEGTRKMMEPLALARPATRQAFFSTLEAFGHEFLAKQLSPPRLTMLRLMIARAAENPDAVGDPDASVRKSVGAPVVALCAAARRAGLVRFASAEQTAGTFFFVLQGDLVMRALLDPAFRIGHAERMERVVRAIEAIAALEAVAQKDVAKNRLESRTGRK